MKNILKKIYLIQKDIDVIPKEGFNNFNKYNYLMEAQVTTKIKELLDKHQVVFNYSSKVTETKDYQGAKGDTQFLVTVEVIYSFYDVESGESFCGIACGQGSDKGDKGVYKAITGAIKYVYMKTFNIPTGDNCEKYSPKNTNYAPKKVNSQPTRTIQNPKVDVPF